MKIVRTEGFKKRFQAASENCSGKIRKKIQTVHGKYQTSVSQS